jgi:maleylacetate reductase
VLGPRCAGTFDAMPPHTPRAAVIAAADQARAADADIIVTIGGGSITDGAKAVQLCLANDIRHPDDIDRIRAGRGASPQLAAPTVRQISVHTPEWLWLSTGIRAVDHCVEGICSREAHPYGDAQALKGLSMLAQALPRVKADAKDLDARMDCQIGTWLSTGPLASGVPMGASHGIGYVLGAEFGVPHGYTSCVMLPSVMRWNKSANAERQALVAAAMGHPHEDAGGVLDRFIRGLGMPRSLSEVKVDPEHFDRIAQAAMATPWVPRNPRKIEGPAQVREILDMAA